MDTTKQAKELWAPGRLASKAYDKYFPVDKWKFPGSYDDVRQRAATRISADGSTMSLEDQQKLQDSLTVQRDVGHKQTSRMYGEIADWSTVLALLGGGVGLAQNLPKLLELRKLPKAKERAKEAQKLSADPGDYLGAASQLPGALNTPGMAAGILPAAGVGSFLGSIYLADWITDRIRAKEMKERKKGLQREFEELLVKPASSKLSTDLEKMAELYKESDESVFSRFVKRGLGLGTLLAALIGYAGFEGGRSLRKKFDPNVARAAALEHALRLRQHSMPTAIKLNTVSPEEVLEPDEVLSPERPPLSKGPIEMPFAIQGKKKREQRDEYDEALSLLKMGQFGGVRNKLRGIGTGIKNTASAVQRLPGEIGDLRQQIGDTSADWQGKYNDAMTRMQDMDTEWGGRMDAGVGQIKALQEQVRAAHEKITGYDKLFSDPRALMAKFGPSLRAAGGQVGEGLPGGVYRGAKRGIGNAVQQHVVDPVSRLFQALRGGGNNAMNYMTGGQPAGGWWQSFMGMLGRLFGGNSGVQPV